MPLDCWITYNFAQFSFKMRRKTKSVMPPFVAEKMKKNTTRSSFYILLTICSWSAYWTSFLPLTRRWNSLQKILGCSSSSCPAIKLSAYFLLARNTTRSNHKLTSHLCNLRYSKTFYWKACISGAVSLRANLVIYLGKFWATRLRKSRWVVTGSEKFGSGYYFLLDVHCKTRHLNCRRSR